MCCYSYRGETGRLWHYSPDVLPRMIRRGPTCWGAPNGIVVREIPLQLGRNRGRKLGAGTACCPDAPTGHVASHVLEPLRVVLREQHAERKRSPFRYGDQRMARTMAHEIFAPLDRPLPARTGLWVDLRGPRVPSPWSYR